MPEPGSPLPRQSGARTQYESRVSSHVRTHTGQLLRRWEAEGRNDTEVGAMVRALVLNAYVEGQRNLVNEMTEKNLTRNLPAYDFRDYHITPSAHSAGRCERCGAPTNAYLPKDRGGPLALCAPCALEEVARRASTEHDDRTWTLKRCIAHGIHITQAIGGPKPEFGESVVVVPAAVLARVTEERDALERLQEARDAR